MIQVCIMGAQEGRMRPEKKIYVTLMGACELVRPTLARQILAQRSRSSKGENRPHTQFFLTLMGATVIKVPTLAEEFIDLREMIASGSLTPEDWSRSIADLGSSAISVASFTLMAGFSEDEVPTENEEVDSLAVQRHLGNISDSAGEILQYGIGQRNAERWATLGRAVRVDAQQVAL